MLALLEAQADKRYAIYVSDASTDPVVVAVGVRNIATFEMEIPLKYYDGMELLELVENYGVEKQAYEGALVALNATPTWNIGPRQGCNRGNIEQLDHDNWRRLISLCLIVLSLGVAPESSENREVKRIWS